MSPKRNSLWCCPRCGRQFANRNQFHVCIPEVPLSAHFDGKGAQARKLFNAFHAELRRIARSQKGPLMLFSTKTRIGFQARTTFAEVMVRKDYLRGSLWLARHVRHSCLSLIATLSPRKHCYEFRLDHPTDLDRRFRQFLAETYRVGRQEHLRRA